MKLPLLFLRCLVYVSNFCFFPPVPNAGWQGQARLSALEAMGRIIKAKALITPGLRASRDAAGGEMRDAILLYLGIKKRAGEEYAIWGSVFW